MENKKLEAKLHALPAGDGDCIIFQYQDVNEQYHNILIDGGNRNQLEFNKQKKKILEILHPNKGTLDLVIITHSDDDHIKGILKLLVDEDLSPFVKKIWFNSERTICNFIESESKDTQLYKINPPFRGVVKSSRTQDNNLYHLLDGDPRWDKEIIIAGKKESIENLDITVLSPTKDNLIVLNNYWPTQKLGPVKSSSSKKFDYDITLNEFINNEVAFTEDTSPVNGSSIALLFEWLDKKFLLLADSFPSTIVDSLNKLNLSTPINLDAMKVSHHGSKNNTSDDLLNQFTCKNYIISANANKKHYHPNKQALCRILKHNGIDKTVFYFTHCNSDLRRIFISEPNINTVYPATNEDGACFYYEC